MHCFSLRVNAVFAASSALLTILERAEPVGLCFASASFSSAGFAHAHCEKFSDTTVSISSNAIAICSRTTFAFLAGLSSSTSTSSVGATGDAAGLVAPDNIVCFSAMMPAAAGKLHE